MSHLKCQTERGHVCQQPSGRTCVEHGCDEAAGTSWGPMWCPQHDQERLDRLRSSWRDLEATAAELGTD